MQGHSLTAAHCESLQKQTNMAAVLSTRMSVKPLKEPKQKISSFRMIILRCTVEPQQLSDSFIIHYSTISWNWHCWLWSKPKQSHDILKEVFHMISVTDCISSKHYQCLKGYTLCACDPLLREMTESERWREREQDVTMLKASCEKETICKYRGETVVSLSKAHLKRIPAHLHHQQNESLFLIHTHTHTWWIYSIRFRT